ncbi:MULTISPECIES: ABC transporter permease [Microcella]|uniref:ABC transporter permease n=1 Tax=Microcella TaxID=337004 RepID=UPI0015CF6A0B|nr:MULTISPECIES: ABC transporter permease [Microcella]QOD93097.1 ABC transporter permease [Chryseoglobus sp. 28M-23]
MLYILRRLGHTAVVLLGVSIVVFALIQLVPGDPVRLALGTRFSQESYDALRAASGLDQPLIVQFFSYLGGAVTGDLGVSFRSGRPVTLILLERLPATLSLAGAGMVVAILISFPLGIYAALRSGKASDAIVRMISQAGVSVPDFWMALLLILGFSASLRLLPSSGYVAFGEDPIEWLRHVTIPAVTVGLIAGSIMTRYVRSSVLEVLGSDHVRTARSKGLRERIVIGRHVVRNALVPIITVGGVQLATMLGGVIVVEVVVAWPGLGRLVYDAVAARDYPVIQGAVLLVAVMFLLINLAVDLLYARIDPRIRLS